ncbi:MAG TPA: hypothetical protein VH328_03660 [Burkholderiaceae bacterium]|jgi:hypothetical protein|nr:hypothetical protein [Burkholderiaceae bacterium]
MANLHPRGRRGVLGALVALALLVPGAPAFGYEADVHYGLTRWLALEAGFDPGQAEAVATGDERVDGGMLETTELALEYACARPDRETALLAQRSRYPSSTPVPAEPSRREVHAGDAAASAALAALKSQWAGKEAILLGQFGLALHSLQDSWSHQGVPSVAAPGLGLACDPHWFGGHPEAAGGPTSHAADLTLTDPARTVAMAQATYEALLAYPRILGRARSPAAWSSLEHHVDLFAHARTKSAKLAWFLERGIEDNGFLGGLTLPDGTGSVMHEWRGLKPLPLPGDASTQPGIDASARQFFDQLLARWMGAGPIEPLAREVALASDAAHVRELGARLALWKLRDHGTAAPFVHAPAPLSAAALRSVDRLVRVPHAGVSVDHIADAVFALQPISAHPEPMVPYIAVPLPALEGHARMLAVLRFRHAPADTVGLVAQQAEGHWKLVGVTSVVDE